MANMDQLNSSKEEKSWLENRSKRKRRRMCRWQGFSLPIQDFHKVELNVPRGRERIPLLFYDAFCFRVRDDISCGYVSVWGSRHEAAFSSGFDPRKLGEFERWPKREDEEGNRQRNNGCK